MSNSSNENRPGQGDRAADDSQKSGRAGADQANASRSVEFFDARGFRDTRSFGANARWPWKPRAAE